jgi:endo-1,4-beta-xylanase
MKTRRVVFVAATLLGTAAGFSLAGCGGPEEDTAQAVEAGDAAARTPSYSQEWKTGNDAGTVSYSRTNGYTSYSLSWSNMASTGDLVYGTGWNPGNDDAISYTGSFTNSCGGCYGIYGWTTNALVEYYVCDAWGQREGPHNSSTESPQYKCSFVSDGDAYDVYYNMRRNAANITGQNQDFPQYISVRRTPRTGGGTITLKNHIDAWASSACGSLRLGNREREVLGTEAWGRSACGTASGSSQVTLNVSVPAQVSGAKVKTWGYGVLDFSWNAVSGTTGYTVTRATIEADKHVSAVVNTNTTSTTLSEMVPDWNKTYQYSVAARNSYGRAGPSPKAITVLRAPTATLTTSGRTLTIRWDAVQGATSYTVMDGGGVTKYSGTTRSWSTTLNSGDWYVYMVKASDGTTLGTAWLTMGYMP